MNKMMKLLGGGKWAAFGVFALVACGGAGAEPTAADLALSDPDCATPSAHALPAKCAPDVVDCNIKSPFGDTVCLGKGVCPNSKTGEKTCTPYIEHDFAACSDGRMAECAVGTCGTDAGSGCDMPDSKPGTFCPCVKLGSVQP